MTQVGIRKSTTKSASEETALVLATQVWVALSAIATQGLLAWLLGPAGRGSYAVCVLFATVSGVVFSLGVDRAAQYLVMAKSFSVSIAVGVMIWIIGAGSVVAMIFGLLFMDSPIEFFGKAEPLSFRISLVLIPLTLFWTAFRLQLAGLRRFAELARITVIGSTANFVFVLLLVGLLAIGVNGALVAQILFHILVLSLAIHDMRRRSGMRFVVLKKEYFTRVISYGLRYYVARIGHVIDTGLGTLLLAFFASRIELGLFASASALALSILMVSQSVEVTLLPRIAENSTGRPALVAQVARVATVATMGISIAIASVAEPLVRIILSPSFLDAVPLIRILAIGVVIQSFNLMLMSFFRGNNYPHICSWAVWAGFMANIAGILWLYPRIGVAGAAVAMSMGFAARAIILSIFFCRINGMKFSSLIGPTRGDWELVKRMGNSALRRIA